MHSVSKSDAQGDASSENERRVGGEESSSEKTIALIPCNANDAR